MKASKQVSDLLLRSFATFQVCESESKTISGGQNTNGSSADSDGCTAVWADNSDGGYTHQYDSGTMDTMYRG